MCIRCVHTFSSHQLIINANRVNFFIQPLLHLKACARSRFHRLIDITLAVVGVICCIYTTTLTIYNWAGGVGAPESPGYCDSSAD